MASTKISRTFGTPTSTKIGTFSFWLKLSSTDSSMGIINNYGDNNNRAVLYISSQQLRFYDAAAGDNPYSSRKLRDFNGWMHIVLRIDTTQATASDRCRIYINGEQETLTNTAYVQNENSYMFNANTPFTIGRDEAASSGQYLDGYISHFHYCDGQSYAPTVFGSTDSITGQWKINTSPSVTYGNQGFLILKDGNTITDQSSNSNDFSIGSGTLTNTQDCPSNNFCTINPLSSHSAITLSKGNTQVDYSTNAENGKGNLAFSSGKFYWEAKMSAVNSNYPMIGIGSVDEAQMQKPSGGSYPGGFTNSYGIYGNGNVYANGSNTGSQSFTYTTNDYIGIAVDLDSGTKTIKWFKNGTQIATYNITTTAPFAPMDYSGSGSDELVYNFGNGAFGTTQLTGTTYQGSGNLGIFKYQPPSGYTALCTKGLNE